MLHALPLSSIQQQFTTPLAIDPSAFMVSHTNSESYFMSHKLF